MTLQALGGVNSPCDWYRVRGQPLTTGGQEQTTNKGQWDATAKLVKKQRESWQRMGANLLLELQTLSS
jgi:hypothetical protein